MNGAIIIDKPAGLTSHDVVNRVRRISGQRRVGHLGTLDPFATGVLVVLLGKTTRLARFFDGASKSYEAVMRMGFATDTYDRTGKPLGPDRAAEFRADQLEALLEEFRGSILQRPPAYSAKKISGVPAYRKARKGQDVELAPVPVMVADLGLKKIEGTLVYFSVTVSSGTYIRSLAHDIGARLGLGAHLTELRRTAVGEFTLDHAVGLENLATSFPAGSGLQEFFIPPESLLPAIPVRSLSADETKAVLHGRAVSAEPQGEWLRLLNPDGQLVALARAEAPGWYHPEVVLLDAVPDASESTAQIPDPNSLPTSR